MSKARINLTIIVSACALAMVTTTPMASATTPGVNGRIAYATQLDTGYQLMTIGPDGSHVRQISNRAETDSTNPDWSSDGRRIVSDVDPFDNAGPHLVITDPHGGHLQRVKPMGLPGPVDQPVFTPDGRHIVFERADPSLKNDNIWMMRRDGSDVQQLTDNPFDRKGGYDTDPNVSPDGKVVSFVRIRVEGAEQALYSVRIDGTHLRQLTPYSYNVAIKHDWAPDGKHIVITIHANPSKPHLSANVATIRPDGSGLRLLTHFRGRTVNALVGSYSPDGRWIVYRTETGDSLGTLDGGLFGLYEVHPWGGKPKLIAGLVGRPRFIDWGPRPTR